MRIHNAEHTICYIDPNMKYVDGSVEGDGSSPSTPLFNFPTSNFQNNVVYLIRRSEFGYFAELPRNLTTSNVTSMVILGMPQEGETFWDELPAAVKTAWKDSSITKKAYVCHKCDENLDNRCGWHLTSCRNFTMHNITFMNYNPHEWDKEYDIYCNSGYGVNGDIRNCDFGPMNLLEVGSEIHVMGVSDYNPGNYCGCSYIHLGDNWSNICTLENVKITSYYHNRSIYMGKPKNIIINNVAVHARQDSGGDSDIGWGWDEWRAPYVRINNCSYLLYYCDRRDCWMHRFCSGRVERVELDGFTAGISTNQKFNPYDGRVGIRNILDFSSRFTGSLIQNVTMTFKDFHGAAYSLLSFYYQNDNDTIYTPPQQQYTHLKNITITMCDTVDAKYGCTSHNDSGGNNFNSSSPGLISLNSASRNRLASSDFLLQDVYLSGIRSNVLYAANTILDLTDIDIVGNVALYNCVGKIKSVKIWYPGYAVRDDGANLLYIGKIEVNLANTSYTYNKQAAVSISGRSHILVHETNGNCWTSDYWDPAYPHSYVCTNDGLSGNYTCRTGRSKCQVWSAANDQTETGCSLKLINESADDWHWPLRIGYDPFKGITKHVAAGSYDATFFMALYGYNIRFDEIKDRMFIRIKLPNGAYVYSNAGTCVEDNETVWSNVEGTTNYKITIPLDVEEAGDIEIDFTWSFYMDGGMTFLDPYPKLTARV